MIGEVTDQVNRSSKSQVDATERNGQMRLADDECYPFETKALEKLHESVNNLALQLGEFQHQKGNLSSAYRRHTLGISPSFLILTPASYSCEDGGHKARKRYAVESTWLYVS